MVGEKICYTVHFQGALNISGTFVIKKLQFGLENNPNLILIRRENPITFGKGLEIFFSVLFYILIFVRANFPKVVGYIPIY